MDSYTLTKKLRVARREFELSAGAQALFYELIAINNEKKWSATFKCRNNELEGALEVSEKTLISYRDELLNAGLITFKSGKKRHAPNEYSLSDYSFNSACENTKDCKNYSHTGAETPDPLKHSIVSEIETKTFVEDDDNAGAEKKEDRRYTEEERDELLAHFAGKDVEPKEKSSAKKEKRVLPPVADVMLKLADFEYWRIALEHHCLGAGMKWDKLISAQQKVYEDARAGYFEIFYEQQADCYQARGMPTWQAMAQHFYNWLPIHLTKNERKNLMNGSTKSTSNGNAQHHTAGDRNARNKGIEDIITGSEGFLRQSGGEYAD